MTAGDINIIPHFIAARSTKALMQKMHKNNTIDSIQYKYFDISISDGTWYAWYYKKVEI